MTSISLAASPVGAAGDASAPPDEAALTRNERLVLEALRAGAAPLKAYELLDALHDRGLRAPMTIYRALGALAERGLAKKIASLNAFMAASGRQDVAFVICRRCGRAEERPLPREAIDALRLPAGAVEHVYFEAYRDCGLSDCDWRGE